MLIFVLVLGFLFEYIRQKKKQNDLKEICFSHIGMQTVQYLNHEFPVKIISNPGSNNDCLGYALGNFLKCSPKELRESFKRLVIKNACDQEFLKSVVMTLQENCEHVSSGNEYNVIMSLLNQQCFIPADFFLLWCARSDDKEHLLLKSNIVFFVKREEFFEPVTYWFDDITLSTCYIGCSNFHFEQLIMQKKNCIWFDLLFFDKKDKCFAWDLNPEFLAHKTKAMTN
jgi:hypothetical protein